MLHRWRSSAAPGGHRSLHATACPRQPRPRLQAACSGLYSFAEVEPKEEGRKNRGRLKRQARDTRDIVHGLCHMTEKQLKAATAICGASIADAVRVAAKLPRTNQGRKRQEQLVAKLLRTQLDDGALSKLAEAVELSRSSNNSWTDRDVLLTIDTWRAGLVAGDQDVLQEVVSLLTAVDADVEQHINHLSAGKPEVGAGGLQGPAEPALLSTPAMQGVKWLPSPQEFRALVLRCQAAAAELRAAQESASPGASGSSTNPRESDGENELEGSPGVITRVTSDGQSKSSLDQAAKKHRQLMRALNGVLRQLAALTA